MGLTKLMATVRQDRGHCRYQARLLVAEHGQDGPREVLERFQKGFERGLILLAEPATAQRHATGEFADEPNLGLAPLRSQAVESHDQAALLLGNLGQTIPVLPLVAGQKGQIDLLIQIAHVGLRDADLGGQFGVNLAVRGAGLLPPPANAHDDVVAIGGAGRRDALPLRLTAGAGASLHTWRAGSDPVDSPPRGRDRASARSYSKPDSCTSRADRHNEDRSGAQVDKLCAHGRIIASGFSWAPPGERLVHAGRV